MEGRDDHDVDGFFIGGRGDFRRWSFCDVGDLERDLLKGLGISWTGARCPRYRLIPKLPNIGGNLIFI